MVAANGSRPTYGITNLDGLNINVLMVSSDLRRRNCGKSLTTSLAVVYLQICQAMVDGLQTHGIIFHLKVFEQVRIMMSI